MKSARRMIVGVGLLLAWLFLARSGYVALADGALVPGGPPVSVSIDTLGQTVTLSFDGAAGQQISGVLSGWPNYGCDQLAVRLLAPSDQELASTGTCGTEAFLDTTTLPSAGIYRLEFNYVHGNHTGGGTAQLYNVPDVSGTLVSDGSPVAVALGGFGQNGRYTFSGTAGQQVSALLTGWPIYGCDQLSVVLRGPSGQQLGQTGTCGTEAFLDNTTLPSDGTYTLLIDPRGTLAGSGTLRLFLVPDQVGTIVADGPAVAVNLTGMGQNGRFTFQGTAGQRISADLTGWPIYGCDNLVVALIAPGGQRIGEAGTCGTEAFLDNTTLPTTGTYTLLIDPRGTLAGSGALRLFNVPDHSGTLALDSPPTAVTLATKGQNGRYTFAGTTGQQISLYLQGWPNYGCDNLTVALYAPGGQLLGIGGTCGTAVYILDTILPAAGTYSVVVDPRGTLTGTGALWLYTPGDRSGALTLNVATGVTLLPNQNGRYTFVSVAGQKVSLVAAGVTIPTSAISILKPEGTTLTSLANVGSSGGFIDATALPVNGTYTVLIDPQGLNSGDVTITVYDADEITGLIAVDGAAANPILLHPGQNARYTFQGNASQRINAALIGWSNVGCGHVSVRLLDPQGQLITQGSGCGADAFLGVRTLSASGVYSLILDPVGEFTGSGALWLVTGLNDIPPPYTHSWYVQDIDDDEMRYLGYLEGGWFGAQNISQGLAILDFGQVTKLKASEGTVGTYPYNGYGTFRHDGDGTFTPDSTIVRAVAQYASSWYVQTNSTKRLYILIGTSNYHQCPYNTNPSETASDCNPREAGRYWAQVAYDAQQLLNQAGQGGRITIWSGNDIETGQSPQKAGIPSSHYDTFDNTLLFIQGFSAQVDQIRAGGEAPVYLLDYGDAAEQPTWNAEAVWTVAWGASLWVSPLPQSFYYLPEDSASPPTRWAAIRATQSSPGVYPYYMEFIGILTVCNRPVGNLDPILLQGGDCTVLDPRDSQLHDYWDSPARAWLHFREALTVRNVLGIDPLAFATNLRYQSLR